MLSLIVRRDVSINGVGSTRWFLYKGQSWSWLLQFVVGSSSVVVDCFALVYDSLNIIYAAVWASVVSGEWRGGRPRGGRDGYYRRIFQKQLGEVLCSTDIRKLKDG